MLFALLLFAWPGGDEAVVFLGADCPLARLYASRLNELSERYPQVGFRGINASEQDSEAEVAFFWFSVGLRRTAISYRRFSAPNTSPTRKPG